MMLNKYEQNVISVISKIPANNGDNSAQEVQLNTDISTRKKIERQLFTPAAASGNFLTNNPYKMILAALLISGGLTAALWAFKLTALWVAGVIGAGLFLAAIVVLAIAMKQKYKNLNGWDRFKILLVSGFILPVFAVLATISGSLLGVNVGLFAGHSLGTVDYILGGLMIVSIFLCWAYLNKPGSIDEAMKGKALIKGLKKKLGVDETFGDHFKFYFGGLVIGCASVAAGYFSGLAIGNLYFGVIVGIATAFLLIGLKSMLLPTKEEKVESALGILDIGDELSHDFEELALEAHKACLEEAKSAEGLQFDSSFSKVKKQSLHYEKVTEAKDSIWTWFVAASQKVKENNDQSGKSLSEQIKSIKDTICSDHNRDLSPGGDIQQALNVKVPTEQGGDGNETYYDRFVYRYLDKFAARKESSWKGLFNFLGAFNAIFINSMISLAVTFGGINKLYALIVPSGPAQIIPIGIGGMPPWVGVLSIVVALAAIYGSFFVTRKAIIKVRDSLSKRYKQWKRGNSLTKTHYAVVVLTFFITAGFTYLSIASVSPVLSGAWGLPSGAYIPVDIIVGLLTVLAVSALLGYAGIKFRRDFFARGFKLDLKFLLGVFLVLGVSVLAGGACFYALGSNVASGAMTTLVAAKWAVLAALVAILVAVLVWGIISEAINSSKSKEVGGKADKQDSFGAYIGLSLKAYVGLIGGAAFSAGSIMLSQGAVAIGITVALAVICLPLYMMLFMGGFKAVDKAASGFAKHPIIPVGPGELRELKQELKMQQRKDEKNQSDNDSDTEDYSGHSSSRSGSDW